MTDLRTVLIVSADPALTSRLTVALGGRLLTAGGTAGPGELALELALVQLVEPDCSVFLLGCRPDVPVDLIHAAAGSVAAGRVLVSGPPGSYGSDASAGSRAPDLLARLPTIFAVTDMTSSPARHRAGRDVRILDCDVDDGGNVQALLGALFDLIDARAGAA